MEPMTKAILVGCGPDEAAHVREALAECAIGVEAEFSDAGSAIDTVRLMAAVARRLIDSLMTNATPRNREEVAALARARAAERFAR